MGVGNRVTYVDLGSGSVHTYTIVGSQDSDPFANKISNESPIGSALMGAKKGDTVVAHTKAGAKTLRIQSIE